MDNRYSTFLAFSSSQYFHFIHLKALNLPVPVILLARLLWRATHTSTLHGHLKPLDSMTDHALGTGALRTLPARSAIGAGAPV
jgi:hypothetical protein